MKKLPYYALAGMLLSSVSLLPATSRAQESTGSLTATPTQTSAPIRVSISPRAFKEDTGRVSRVVISRLQRSTEALTITLTPSLAGQLLLPNQVVIPAGQNAVTFFIGALKDNVIEGTQSISIAFSTSGGSVTQDVFVLDNTARVSLNIVPRAIREDAGSRAATGTLTISQVSDVAVTVRLASSEPTRVRVPASVTIPAGARSATFPIEVVDNSTVENDRRVDIVLNSGVTGAGLQRVPLIIIDDDKQKQPKFVLAVQPLNEGSNSRVARGTIKVNRDLDEDVTFQLSSSSDKVQVPAQVTLSEGQKLVTFPITVVDNAMQDGKINVTITATSSLITLRETVKVRDDESKDDDDNDNDGDVSAVRVSATSALASTNSITLGFTGPLSANSVADDDRYQVRVGGLLLAVEDVSYSAADNAITLLLEDNVPLRVGDRVVVSYRDLRDASGKRLENRSVTLTVR
jgi:hypothetical protein